MFVKLLNRAQQLLTTGVQVLQDGKHQKDTMLAEHDASMKNR